jgi:hypothetical protein
MRIISKSGELREVTEVPIKRKLRGKMVQAIVNGTIAVFDLASGKRRQRDGLSPNDFILKDDWVLVR